MIVNALNFFNKFVNIFSFFQEIGLIWQRMIILLNFERILIFNDIYFQSLMINFLFFRKIFS